MAIAAPADDPGEEDLQAAEDTRAGSDVERAVSDRATHTRRHILSWGTSWGIDPEAERTQPRQAKTK